MAKKILVIITLIIYIFGCAQTNINYQKVNLDSQPSKMNEINAILKNKNAKIILTSGSELDVKSPQIARDSTFWIDTATHNNQSAATSDIKKIIIQRPEKGAEKYLKQGALVGGAYGILFGFSFVRGAKRDKDRSLENYIKFTTIWGATFAAIGGLFGLPIGAAIGSEEHYIISVPKDTSLNKIEKN